MKFLFALYEANPDPATDWLDTRPPELKEFDLFRFKQGRPPLFFPRTYDLAQRRKHRPVNEQFWTSHVETPWLYISNYFFITALNDTGRSAQSRAAAAIEAYGLGLITPINEPEPLAYHLRPPNQGLPSKPHRTKKWELTF